MVHSWHFMELDVKEQPAPKLAVYGAGASFSRASSPIIPCIQQGQSPVSQYPEAIQLFPGGVGEHVPPLMSQTRLLE